MHSSSANPALFFRGGGGGTRCLGGFPNYAYSYQGLYTNLFRNTLFLQKPFYTPPGKSQVLNPLAICDFPGGRGGGLDPHSPLGGRG